MARPRREIYDKEKKKYFYYKSKKDKKQDKRTYVRTPAGMTQKQFTTINNHIHIGDYKRIKPKSKKQKITYSNKVTSNVMTPFVNQFGLPLYQSTIPPQTPNNFSDAKYIKTADQTIPVKDISKDEKKTTIEHLPPEAVDMISGYVGNLTEAEKKQQEKEKEERKARETEMANRHTLAVNFIKNIPNNPQGGRMLSKIENHYKNEHLKNEKGEYVLKDNKKIPKFQVNKLQKIPERITALIQGYKENEPAKQMDINEINNLLEEKGAEESKGHKGHGEIKGEGIDDGLYNDEIEKIAKSKLKGHYVPVIPSDKINNLPNLIKPKNKIFGAIINTNPSNSDGSGNDGYKKGHWVSVIVDGRDDFKTIEFFDPLVKNKPSPELLGTLKHIAEEIDPTKKFLLKINRIRRQAKNSSACGVHALKFIEDRIRGEPWSKATGYDHWKASKSKGLDDSKNGEQKIEKVKKIYKQYL